MHAPAQVHTCLCFHANTLVRVCVPFCARDVPHTSVHVPGNGTRGQTTTGMDRPHGRSHACMHHAHVPCAMRMCICARAPPASMPSARAYTHTLSCGYVCRLKIACMYVYVAPAWTMAYCHGRLPLLMAACLLSAGTTPTPQRSGRGDKLTVHVHTPPRQRDAHCR